MAAVKFMKCTLCHIFATSKGKNMSDFLYILMHDKSVLAKYDPQFSREAQHEASRYHAASAAFRYLCNV